MKGIRISPTGDPFLLESDASYFALAAKHIDLEGARLLVWESSTALATFCTLEHNGYLRLKNLLVDPAHRRRGIGERIIRALEGLATRERLQGVLAFAMSGGPGEFLYQSAGMKPIGRVIEWRKRLS